MKHSKKMCFPGDGKSDRLVGKELTVFVCVFVCLLELPVFNLLITRSCWGVKLWEALLWASGIKGSLVLLADSSQGCICIWDFCHLCRRKFKPRKIHMLHSWEWLYSHGWCSRKANDFWIKPKYNRTLALGSMFSYILQKIIWGTFYSCGWVGGWITDIVTIGSRMICHLVHLSRGCVSLAKGSSSSLTLGKVIKMMFEIEWVTYIYMCSYM